MNILFINPGDNSGSSFYRIQQPAQKLEEHGLAIVGLLQGNEPIGVKVRAMKGSNVLVFARSTSPRLADQFKVISGCGKTIVMDIDDDWFNVSPYSPHYQRLGTEEVVHAQNNGDILHLWKDGENINLEENRRTIDQFKKALEAAHLITVTGPYLAELYGEFGKTAVLPNFVDLNIWKVLEVKYPEPYIRLGWRGGHSHYEDLLQVQPVIKELMDKHKNLKLIMAGWCPKGWKKHLPPERIEEHPWLSNAAYPYGMMTLGIDVAFCPRQIIPFNKGKSWLAWIEWSAMGIPGVYAAMEPFTSVIRHGDNGMIAASQQGWYEGLNKLITHHQLRKDMGMRARKDIEEKADVNREIYRYKEAYEAI